MQYRFTQTILHSRLYGNPDKGNRLVMSWEGEKTDMILNILKPEKNVGVIMLYNAKAKQNVR